MAANGGEEPMAALDGEALPKEAVLPKGHEELVLVVASPKQVADLIADLQADAQLFAAASGVARGDSELAEGGQATAGTEHGAQAQGGFGGGFRETPPEEGLGAKDESPNLVKAIESLSRQGDAGAWRLKWARKSTSDNWQHCRPALASREPFGGYAQPSQEAAPPSEAAPGRSEAIAERSRRNPRSIRRIGRPSRKETRFAVGAGTVRPAPAGGTEPAADAKAAQ